MQLTTTSVLSILVGCTFAKMHNVAVCVTNRKYSEIGGTAFSPSYTWSKDYEILPDATKCACDLYKQRNTGDKQWDQCPDCTFDGNYCNSADWHIGGDEITYYCEEMCHAQGAEGN
ncbi:hypothetical protein N7481_002103 [Penicillium waksmanii]|uniref:uncharacterized protein n=1 Tax=Penicillium waksmanii TaxID=69791 RepID=UPI002547D56F|nr:uncharacterized protein N7481_002103 [Penicillium waksmanii]KAJ5995126.1 hypothetical protein N7481_002103 [Penicillium waksmanii]